MHRFDDAFYRNAFCRLFTGPPDNAIAGNQRTNSAANIAAVYHAIGGLDVGMHAETADYGAFRRFAEEVIVVIDFLRSGCKAALMVGFYAALLPFGEFIFTQSCWLLVAPVGQNLYDTH